MRRLSLIIVLSSYFTVSCEEETEKYGNGIFNFDSTTIVSESTPSNLQSSATLQTSDEITQVRDRLYLSQADNTIPNMIQVFQSRIDELNTRTADLDEDAVPDCINETPTDTSIITPDGQTFALKVSCYEELSETSFMIWGVDGDGVSYIFERSSASISVVKVTPQDDDTNIFDGYLTFYSTTANEAGTVVHVVANQSAKTVQANMVAPHEVCAVNMYADAEKIHFRGSISTGTANECPAEADFVYAVSDLSTSTGFDASLLLDSAYFMKRKAGTKLVNGTATQYEEYANTSGSGNTSLAYNADPTSDASDVNFGPTTADELGGIPFAPK